MNNAKKIIIFVIAGLALQANFAFASVGTLPHLRAFYGPNGEVYVTTFVSGACRGDETETQCMDRITQQNPTTKDLPYDDVTPDQLPKDKSERDKWRGAKGQGVRIDHSLVTKNEKWAEIQQKIDQELAKDSPDATAVVKLQGKLAKVKKISDTVLTQDDLASLEDQKKSFVAAAIQAVGDLVTEILNGIKNGFLALKNLVIGSPETPSGVTIYDVVTKQPYCSVVANGQNVSIAGVCSPELIQNYLTGSSSPSSDLNVPTDTEAPIIQLNGLNPAEIEVGATYSDMGVTVTDNISQNLGYKVKLDDGPEIYPNELVLDTSIAGTHTIIYSAIDQAGNVGTATRTVKVVEPNVTVVPAPAPEPAQEPTLEPALPPATEPTPTP